MFIPHVPPRGNATLERVHGSMEPEYWGEERCCLNLWVFASQARYRPSPLEGEG